MKEENKRKIAESKASKIIRTFFAVCLALVISFLKSLFDLAWGISSFFLLVGFITYFKVDASNVLLFLKITALSMQYWGLFFMALMIYHLQDKLKSLGVI